MKHRSKRSLAISAVVTLFLILLDQLTKLLAAAGLKGKSSLSLIDGVFELYYLENQSAAFSMDPVSIMHKIFHFTYFDENPAAFLRAKMIFFVVFTIAVMVFIVIIYCRVPENKRFLPFDIVLICFFAGACGNLIDRIWHNYVIDFFYFRLIDFPVFNVADIYVTLAAFALIIEILFYYKDEDMAEVFKK